MNAKMTKKIADMEKQTFSSKRMMADYISTTLYCMTSDIESKKDAAELERYTYWMFKHRYISESAAHSITKAIRRSI